jgi:hypothetical protein
VRATATNQAPTGAATEVRLEVTAFPEPRDAEHEALLRLLFGAAPEAAER